MSNGHRLLASIKDNYPVNKLIYICFKPKLDMNVLTFDEIDPLFLKVGDYIRALKAIQNIHLPMCGQRRR